MKGMGFAVHKRFYKFVLKRILGRFLANEVDIDNLDVQIGSGLVHLKSLEIDVDVLNEVAAQSNLPITFLAGHLRDVNVTIPWKGIWKESCHLSADGIEISIAPFARDENVKIVDVEDMVQSFVVVDDFNDNDESDDLFESDSDDNDVAWGKKDEGAEGLEILMGFVNKVLSRICLTFTDLTIRFVTTNEPGLPELWLRLADFHVIDETPAENSEAPIPFTTIKTVKFKGLCLQLAQLSSDENIPSEVAPEGYRLNTLAASDPVNDDIITLKMRRGGFAAIPSIPNTDIDVFIKSLHGIITPAQREKIAFVMDAFHIPVEQHTTTPSPSPPPKSSPDVRHLQQRDMDVIEGLLSDLDMQDAAESQIFYAVESDEPVMVNPVSAADYLQTRVKFRVDQMSLTLVVDDSSDELLPAIWSNLSEVCGELLAPSHAFTNELQSDHFVVQCGHTWGTVSMFSGNGVNVNVDVGDAEVWEFVLVDASCGDEKRFCSTRMLHFATVDSPLIKHMPWHASEENKASVTMSDGRLTVDLKPVTIEYDVRSFDHLAVLLSSSSEGSMIDFTVSCPKLHALVLVPTTPSAKTGIRDGAVLFGISGITAVSNEGTIHVECRDVNASLVSLEQLRDDNVADSFLSLRPNPLQQNVDEFFDQPSTGTLAVDLRLSPKSFVNVTMTPAPSDTEFPDAETICNESRMAVNVQCPAAELILTKTSYDQLIELLNVVAEASVVLEIQADIGTEPYAQVEEGSVEGSVVESKSIPVLKLHYMSVHIKIGTGRLVLRNAPLSTFEAVLEDVKALQVVYWNSLPQSKFYLQTQDVLLTEIPADHTLASRNTLRRTPFNFYRKGDSGIERVPNVPTLLMVYNTDRTLTRMIEAHVGVILQGLTMSHHVGSNWMTELIDFLVGDTKKGEVRTAGNRDDDDDDVPEQYLRLSIQCIDTSMDYKPLRLPSRAVAAIGKLKVQSNIIEGSTTVGVKIVLNDTTLYVVDDVVALRNDAGCLKHSTLRGHWEHMGFVQVASLNQVDAFLRINSGSSQSTVVEITAQPAIVHVCSDSMSTLTTLFDHLSLRKDIYLQQGLDGVWTENSNPVIDPVGDIEQDVSEAIGPVKPVTEYEFEMRGRTALGKALNGGEGDAAGAMMRSVVLSGLDGITPSGDDRVILVEPNALATDGEEVDVDVCTFVESHDARFDDEWVNVSMNDLPVYVTGHRREQDKPNVTWIGDGGVNIVENYIAQPTEAEMRWDRLQDEGVGEAVPSIVSVIVKDASIIIRIIDGTDWGERDVPEKDAVQLVGLATEPDMEMDQHDLKTCTPLYPSERNTARSIEVKADGIDVQFDLFEEASPRSYRISVQVMDFEVVDEVKTSEWRKLVCHDSRHARQERSPMIDLLINEVRPNVEKRPDTELRIAAALLPLRLNVDQDALDFLVDFFMYVPRNGPVMIPGMVVPEPYIQHLDLRMVRARIDYQPKRMDLTQIRQGNYAEAIKLFPLESMEVALPRARLSGHRGIESLSKTLVQSWVPHLKNTQLLHYAMGIRPIRSLVRLGAGITDLIRLPIEQYNRDNRIFHGIGRGATAFVRALVSEAVELGTAVVMGTRVVLEHAEDVVTSTDHSDGRSAYANPPASASEGLTQAYNTLSRGFVRAAHTIVAVPMAEYRKAGTGGFVKSVVRAVPIAVLRPVIGATDAVGRALMGIHNELDPGRERELRDKYK